MAENKVLDDSFVDMIIALQQKGLSDEDIVSEVKNACPSVKKQQIIDVLNDFTDDASWSMLE